MSSVVRARIVKVGNSHGVRIPKPLLEMAGLDSEALVDVEAKGKQIVIRQVRHRARAGWEEQFQAMAARGDDRLLEGEGHSLTEWDGREWQW
jgi:antitoxin MazE